MKTSIRSAKFLLLIIVLTALPSISGCGTGEAGVVGNTDKADQTPVPVEVSLVERGDISATYEVTTTIDTDGDAPVLARVAGEVVELLAEEGDHVEEGQILARLDGERLRLEMLEARALLDQARGEYERYVDLSQRGLVSEAMFEGLKYDLDALRASYELKKLNYDYASIRATISGVVSNRSIKPGQHVSANDETFRITDTHELLAYLQIPQQELKKFAAGHVAELVVDSMPNKSYRAEIARISPTIDTRNGTFRATASIDNSANELAPGMFARFEIAYEKHVNAKIIPAGALIEEDDVVSVYIVEGDKVSRRQVKVGIRSDDRVEVLSGINDGEQVVVVGHSSLRDGSKIKA